jgi:hypothetical protein
MVYNVASDGEVVIALPKIVFDAKVRPDGRPSLARSLSFDVCAFPASFFRDISRCVFASYAISYTHVMLIEEI